MARFLWDWQLGCSKLQDSRLQFWQECEYYIACNTALKVTFRKYSVSLLRAYRTRFAGHCRNICQKCSNQWIKKLYSFRFKFPDLPQKLTGSHYEIAQPETPVVQQGNKQWTLETTIMLKNTIQPHICMFSAIPEFSLGFLFNV